MILRPFSLLFGARSGKSFSNLPPVSLNKSRMCRSILGELEFILKSAPFLALSSWLLKVHNNNNNNNNDKNDNNKNDDNNDNDDDVSNKIRNIFISSAKIDFQWNL